MFLTGSRVRVLSSSLSKGMGPRKGSEGFVIQSVTKPFFTATPISFLLNMEDFNLTAFTYNLQFYKFGNEKRERCESRFFTTILPVTTNSVTFEQASTAADTFLSLIFDSTLLKETKVFKQLEDRLGKNHSHFGILQPMGCKKQGDMTLPQTRCWLKAIKRSADVHVNFLSQTKLFETSKLCDKNLLTYFSGITKNRWKQMFENPYEHIDGINTVELHQGLMAIYDNQMMRRAYRPVSTIEDTLQWAANGLLDYPECAEERRKKILNGTAEMGGVQHRIAMSATQMTEILAKKLIDL